MFKSYFNKFNQIRLYMTNQIRSCGNLVNIVNNNNTLYGNLVSTICRNAIHVWDSVSSTKWQNWQRRQCCVTGPSPKLIQSKCKGISDRILEVDFPPLSINYCNLIDMLWETPDSEAVWLLCGRAQGVQSYASWKGVPLIFDIQTRPSNNEKLKQKASMDYIFHELL